MRRAPATTGVLIWCILLLILGLTIMASSLQIGFGRFTRPGPGLFPFLCGAILAVQSIVLYLVDRRSPEKGDDVLRHPGALLRFFWLTVALVLWIVLMPVLGWLSLTFLVTLSIAKIMGAEGWWKPLLLAAANCVFTYVLFGYLLAIDLPLGFWA